MAEEPLPILRTRTLFVRPDVVLFLDWALQGIENRAQINGVLFEPPIVAFMRAVKLVANEERERLGLESKRSAYSAAGVPQRGVAGTISPMGEDAAGLMTVQQLAVLADTTDRNIRERCKTKSIPSVWDGAGRRYLIHPVDADAYITKRRHRSVSGQQKEVAE